MLCLHKVNAGFADSDQFIKLFAEDLVDIPTELSQDIAKRIRDAAEIGDITILKAIAEEIMAEDFDFDGIQKLLEDLDSC